MVTYTEEVSAFFAGYGRPGSLLDALRGVDLCVPLDEHGRYFTYVVDGLPWMLAFTTPERLRDYAELAGRDVDALTFVDTVGALLIDTVLDVAPEPTGLLVDAETDRAMTFPPVRAFTPHCYIDDDGEVVRWN
ncbi:SseB family protein [Gordonia sp. CPCC 205515]|uniref:SseB family protein n=1 Tax=Gordonia sp. CPCC 205515 TaxID=3140791 RepID=UPI003AF34301